MQSQRQSRKVRKSLEELKNQEIALNIRILLPVFMSSISENVLI